jgi:hypothetical protein
MKKIITFIREPKRLSMLNIALLLWAVLLNAFFTVFCIPVDWAILVLMLCGLTTALTPILVLHFPKERALLSFTNGITCCISIYCICFMEGNILGGVLLIIFFGVGFAALMPYFLIGQTLWYHLYKPQQNLERLAFLMAIAFCISICFYAKNAYKIAMDNIVTMEQSNYETLQTDYMTERILGMHFIYHTRLDLYDGWRPPQHDPLMVIGMRLNGDIDPLKIDLKERLRLYKKFFPNRPYKMRCSCQDSQGAGFYHTDKLWEEK